MIPTVPSPALVRSAYEHCTRLAIGMLTSQGMLHPQLFFVGAPTTPDDASTSKVARVGEQAMATFHATQAGADQLAHFIQQSLATAWAQARALRDQIGQPLVAVHACQALVAPDAPIVYPEGAEAAVHSDGRRQCLLVTVHTLHGQQSVWCPIYRHADGQLASQIVAATF